MALEGQVEQEQASLARMAQDFKTHNAASAARLSQMQVSGSHPRLFHSFVWAGWGGVGGMGDVNRRVGGGQKDLACVAVC